MPYVRLYSARFSPALTVDSAAHLVDEGVEIEQAGAQEFQEAHTLEPAGLVDAQEEQVVLNVAVHSVKSVFPKIRMIG